jgi:hypothetical protein
MTWAQTAIIPRNKVTEVNAAASSSTRRNIDEPPSPEQKGNNVPYLFRRVKEDQIIGSKVMRLRSSAGRAAGAPRRDSTGSGSTSRRHR